MAQWRDWRVRLVERGCKRRYDEVLSRTSLRGASCGGPQVGLGLEEEGAPPGFVVVARVISLVVDIAASIQQREQINHRSPSPRLSRFGLRKVLVVARDDVEWPMVALTHRQWAQSWRLRHREYNDQASALGGRERADLGRPERACVFDRRLDQFDPLPFDQVARVCVAEARNGSRLGVPPAFPVPGDLINTQVGCEDKVETASRENHGWPRKTLAPNLLRRESGSSGSWPPGIRPLFSIRRDKQSKAIAKTAPSLNDVSTYEMGRRLWGVMACNVLSLPVS